MLFGLARTTRLLRPFLNTTLVADDAEEDEMTNGEDDTAMLEVLETKECILDTGEVKGDGEREDTTHIPPLGEQMGEFELLSSKDIGDNGSIDEVQL